MIGYVTVGTNDVERARAFYDALLAEVGAKRLFQEDEGQYFTGYGRDMEQPMLMLCRPFDGGEARPGNGPMTGLQLPDRAAVDGLHARALALGASDEGEPGPRGDPAMGFYGAYFRDPDGNKFSAFCIGQG